MKQLVQNLKTGETKVEEVPIPTPKTGMVLVRNAASLVSAGTERMLVDFAEKSLVGKARSRPDLVKQVIDKARREGLLTTVEAAFNRLDQPMVLGYSSAGVVVEVGEGVQTFRVGQRVACAGGGYAVHAEYVMVPENLVVPLPENVTYEHAAFATLGAIAMHGFRLAKPALGETVAVIGLGLLGLIMVQLSQAAGCRVLGIDLDQDRVERGAKAGANAVLRVNAVDVSMAFTKARGVDKVLICADTASNDPVELAGEIARDKAIVVAVGAVGLEIPRRSYFAKELTFLNSRSYGPGRYDPQYEEGGVDYPIGYVRWTEGRNLEAFVELLGDGRIDVEPIITHRFTIDDAPKAYELITGKSDEKFVGVVLTYSWDDEIKKKDTIAHSCMPGSGNRVVRLGVIGAGNFATAMMLPAVKGMDGVELHTIASASGLKAAHAGKKFGFLHVESDGNILIQDTEINTVAVLTRHSDHAEKVVAALQAGKNVFVEKPLAVSAEQLDLVKDQLRKGDSPLLTVGFNRRFAPFGIKLAEFVHARQEPMFAQYRVNAGFLPQDHWLHDPFDGGGRIVGEGCHFVDFLSYLIGSQPQNVTAHGLQDNGKYKEDNVQLTFTYADGSVGALIYLANGDNAFGKERVEVFSGGKVAVLDDFRSLEMIDNGVRGVLRSRLRQDKGHKAIWAAFVKAIIENEIVPIPYEDLIGVTAATFAAVESLRLGKQVEIC